MPDREGKRVIISQHRVSHVANNVTDVYLWLEVSQLPSRTQPSLLNGHSISRIIKNQAFSFSLSSRTFVLIPHRHIHHHLRYPRRRRRHCSQLTLVAVRMENDIIDMLGSRSDALATTSLGLSDAASKRSRAKGSQRKDRLTCRSGVLTNG